MRLLAVVSCKQGRKKCFCSSLCKREKLGTSEQAQAVARSVASRYKKGAGLFGTAAKKKGNGNSSGSKLQGLKCEEYHKKK